MVVQAVARRQIAIGRRLSRRDLPASCAIQTVHGTTGARTTVATVRCRVVSPRGAESGEWLGDQRLVRVLVPVETETTGADLVVVDGGTAYRVVSQDPPRADDLLRALAVVESRESGGPV